MAKKKAVKPLSPAQMGQLGGKSRAKKMTAAERSEAARKAVQARWAKIKKKAT